MTPLALISMTLGTLCQNRPLAVVAGDWLWGLLAVASGAGGMGAVAGGGGGAGGDASYEVGGIAGGVVLGVLVGVGTHVATGWLSGRDKLKDRLDDLTAKAVDERFETLSKALEIKMEHQLERLGAVEQQVAALAEERHAQEMKIANELSALRIAIAKDSASKSDISELREAVQTLTVRVTELAARPPLTLPPERRPA